MTDKSKIELDELLSAGLDEALTQRQQTELKRLLTHQPEVAQQLAALRRQRELLCTLPVETAPEGLADEVKTRLERQLILSGVASAGAARSKGALARRRFTAAAAMLLLPLTLLGVVMYRILMPPQTATTLPTAKSILDSDPALGVGTPTPIPALAAMPFDGELVLMTERPMLVAQSIEKQIFLKGLEHQTIPNRTAEVMTFQMACPAEAVAELMEALASVWPQLSNARLSLHDAGCPEQTLVIEPILPTQIQTLARQTAKMPMLAAARQYAATNLPLVADDSALAALDTPPSLEELSIPQPILAWPQSEELTTPAAVRSPVRLTIQVRRRQ